MKYESRKRVISLSINAAVIIFETVSLIMGIVLYMKQYGLDALLYYTQLSNAITLIISVIMVVEECRGFSVPVGIQRIEYTAVSMMALTFFINLFVLVPLAEWNSLYEKLFSSTKLFHHFLCPILMMTNFMFFEDHHALGRKDSVLVVIPTLLYAVTLTVLNIMRVVDGPYPYLRVYEQSPLVSVLWFILIIGVSYLLSYVLLAVNKRGVR